MDESGEREEVPEDAGESDPADRRAVRKTYDRIAGHFSQTREYPWPEIEEFLADASPGSVGLDLGCGNGRHTEPLGERVDRVLGLDASRSLLEETRLRANERGVRVDLLQGDAASLPLADGVVDLAVYVATLHHLPEREIRIRSLDELARVLAPGGKALVSAWCTTHDRFDQEEGFDTTVDWTLPDGETVPRFYHIYAPDEFETDLAASDLAVAESFVSSGNCYAVTSRNG